MRRRYRGYGDVLSTTLRYRLRRGPASSVWTDLSPVHIISTLHCGLLKGSDTNRGAAHLALCVHHRDRVKTQRERTPARSASPWRRRTPCLLSLFRTLTAMGARSHSRSRIIPQHPLQIAVVAPKHYRL